MKESTHETKEAKTAKADKKKLADLDSCISILRWNSIWGTLGDRCAIGVCLFSLLTSIPCFILSTVPLLKRSQTSFLTGGLLSGGLFVWSMKSILARLCREKIIVEDILLSYSELDKLQNTAEACNIHFKRSDPATEVLAKFKAEREKIARKINNSSALFQPLSISILPPPVTIQTSISVLPSRGLTSI